MWQNQQAVRRLAPPAEDGVTEPLEIAESGLFNISCSMWKVRKSEECAGQESGYETGNSEQKLFCSTGHLLFSMCVQAHMHTLCTFLHISSFFSISFFLGIVVTPFLSSQGVSVVTIVS